MTSIRFKAMPNEKPALSSSIMSGFGLPSNTGDGLTIFGKVCTVGVEGLNVMAHGVSALRAWKTNCLAQLQCDSWFCSYLATEHFVANYYAARRLYQLLVRRHVW